MTRGSERNEASPEGTFSGKPVRPKQTKCTGRQMGGWRRKGWKVQNMTPGDLRGQDGERRHAGVRAPIVAMKPGNAGGAKGCRKMEVE